MVQIEKTRLNAWNVGAVLVSLFVNAFALGGVYVSFKTRLDEIEGYRQTRSVQTDAKFDGLNARLQPFDTAMFRLTQLETVVKLNNDNINARMDRVVDSLGSKMDVLGGKIDAQAQITSDLRSDVKVLTQKVEANTASKRAAFSLPDEYVIK